MRLIGLEIIEDCKKRYRDSRKPLDRWVTMIKGMKIKNPGELKQMVKSASIVPPHTIFNVAGNKYRVAAIIDYVTQIVLVKFADTHKEYDKGKWKNK